MVMANTAGRVLAVHVKPGDRVRQGDLLVELDDQMLAAELALARARLEAAESRQRAATRAAQAEGASEELRLALRVQQAQVSVAAAACRRAEHMLEFAKIRAPFNGTVRVVHVGPDDPVDPANPNRARILELADLSELLVAVDVHEDAWRHIQEGQPAIATIHDLPDRRFDGHVVSREHAINPTTGTFPLRVAIDPGDDFDLLMAGMQVVVLFSEDDGNTGPAPEK